MKRGQEKRYTKQHAESGIAAPLPPLETWPNQYPGYEITIEIPEYTAICPKPDSRTSARLRSGTCRTRPASNSSR